ncbi:DUF2760 domain-containing protein [Facilibium subflavum]|uniref:DUF2760 domain-containing protein n=1 Tax=Facilibium subflavum TaxID=2219058 RepID=UPI000E65AB66|nr:DUF2760 domain-containing protein [Facilibium subflavum]
MLIKLTWKQRINAFFRGKINIAQPAPNPDRSQYDHSAKQLLTILQKKGRFIDFVYQNIDHFSDAEIASAVRVVHQGCQKAIKAHCNISSIRPEAENTQVILEKNDFDRFSVHLTGNIQNQSTITGVLLHKGWQIDQLQLPTITTNANPNIIQPAEIEVI